jgi:alkylated DNA repair dioxygenase AlkB
MTPGHSSKSGQFDLFGAATNGPDGFRYQADVISAEAENRLVDAIAALPFKEFEFHGFRGKRRVVSFGYRYDYAERALHSADPMPPLLLPLRAMAAAFAHLPAEAFRQALVTEYTPGAGIGWHCDKSVYGEVVGISLLAPCIMRFRRAATGGWDRRSLPLQPRSVYLLDGPARWEWEHSIPALDITRYSVTFRRYPRPTPPDS